MQVIPRADRCKCEYCGDTLNARDSHTYVRVTGWAKNRKSGNLGSNAVVLCELMGGYACRYCIRKMIDGIPLEQMELFHLPYSDD